MSIVLSSKQELYVWVAGTLLTIVLFSFSHTFCVTHVTFYVGMPLVVIVAFLYWVRFHKRPTPQPTWLRYLGNALLSVVSTALLLYVIGIATYYE